MSRLKTFRTVKTVLLSRASTMALLLCLFSCDGGQPIGGISGTGKVLSGNDAGLIIGQVEDISALRIDGLTFIAEGTTVLINGKPASINDLRIGMPVTANVNYSDKIFQSINYQPLLSGPIDTVTDDKTSIEILGQTIELSEVTILDGLTLEDIFEDNVIEVGGERTRPGVIIADYVRAPEQIDRYFVVGQLTTYEGAAEGTISGTPVNLEPLLNNNNTQGNSIPPESTIKAELNIGEENSHDLSISVTGAEVIPEVEITLNQTVVSNGAVSRVLEQGALEVKGRIFSVDASTRYVDRFGQPIGPETIGERSPVRITGISTGRNVILAKTIKVKNQSKNTR